MMDDSTLRQLRDRAGTYGLGIAVFAAALLGYIKGEYVFQDAGRANFLVALNGIALFLALGLGLLGLPRLQGFLALFVFTVVAIIYFYSGPLFVVL
jgi:hypothetical protein